MNNTNPKTVENLGKLLAAYQPHICCFQEAAPNIGGGVPGYASSVTVEHNGTAGKGLEIAWRTDTFNLAEGGSHYAGYQGNPNRNTPYRIILSHKASGKSFNITTWHASGEKLGKTYVHAQPCLQGYYNTKNGDEVGPAVTGGGFWIVAGDFNMTAPELASCSFGLKETYTAVHNQQGFPLDHVIVKSQVCTDAKRVKIDDNSIDPSSSTFGSDAHRPLIVDISW
jgi:hypothetical protein